MRKSVLAFWLGALIPIGIGAADLGVVSNSDYLRFEVFALDSSGIPATPDSGHVLVWYEGETSSDAASYSNRWTDSGAGSTCLDSVRYASHTYYYFVDQVADLDNDEGNGLYTGVVILYTDGLPTSNRFTFTLADDELSDYWAAVARMADSVDAYDDWVARQTEVANLDGWDPADDSTHISGLNAARLASLDNLDAAISDIDDNPWDDADRQLTALDEDVTTIDLNSSAVVPADTNASGQGLALTPGYWTAADSTAYQGSAAGLDSTAVARAVWNAPASNHTSPGTYGVYLDTTVSSFKIGSGAFSTTLVAYDSSNSQVVSGVRVAVWNSDQSSLLAVVATGPGGNIGVNLDSGNYVIAATAPGYIFEPYDTIAVSGVAADTIVGYHFDPGSPASPALCRVYGYLYTMQGTAESGARASAWIPSGVTRLSGIIISPFPVTTTTDATGYFYLDLIPSSRLAGAPLYELTINRADGTVLRKRLAVPDTSSWQLTW